MLLERIFLLPQGLPGQVSYRHALFSPSKHNSYGTVHCTELYSRSKTKTIIISAGSAFPGLADLLHGIEELDTEEKGKRIKELRKESI